jgi:hypothetical protein
MQTLELVHWISSLHAQQTDPAYFVSSNAFDIMLHNLFLCKLCNFGLSSDYENVFIADK